MFTAFRELICTPVLKWWIRNTAKNINAFLIVCCVSVAYYSNRTSVNSRSVLQHGWILVICTTTFYLLTLLASIHDCYCYTGCSRYFNLRYPSSRTRKISPTLPGIASVVHELSGRERFESCVPLLFFPLLPFSWYTYMSTPSLLPFLCT
jgi:hypothetical protein